MMTTMHHTTIMKKMMIRSLIKGAAPGNPQGCRSTTPQNPMSTMAMASPMKMAESLQCEVQMTQNLSQ